MAALVAGHQKVGETEHEYVRRIFDYDKATGILSRRVRIGGASRAGLRLGHYSRKRYLRTCYKGHCIQLHRLVWFYQNGEWPKNQIDHINGVKDDNRWMNLRLASNSQNKMNSDVRADSATQVKGVTIDRRSIRPARPFRAHICVDGKRTWLGYFSSIEEAKAARLAAEPIFHGSFARERAS